MCFRKQIWAKKSAFTHWLPVQLRKKEKTKLTTTETSFAKKPKSEEATSSLQEENDINIALWMCNILDVRLQEVFCNLSWDLSTDLILDVQATFYSPCYVA